MAKGFWERGKKNFFWLVAGNIFWGEGENFCLQKQKASDNIPTYGTQKVLGSGDRIAMSVGHEEPVPHYVLPKTFLEEGQRPA